MGKYVVSAYDNGKLVQRRWPSDDLISRTVEIMSWSGFIVKVDDMADTQCQDAVEGRARFARPNIPRPSKAIGEYSE